MSAPPAPLIYEFVIPGLPIPKGRPRVVQPQRPRKDGGRRKPRAITPERTRIYEGMVRRCGREHIPAPLSGAVGLELRFVVPDRRARDLDNLVKAVSDGLNKVGFCDDTQIERLVAVKVLGSEPRCEVRLYSLTAYAANSEVSHG